MSVPGHDDRDVVVEEQLLQLRKLLVAVSLRVAAGIEGMAQDRHRRLAARAIECRTQPRHLLRIDALDDAGVDGDEGEAVGLDLEERCALKPRLHAVLLAQPSRLPHQLPDAGVGRAGQPQVRLDARAHRRVRGAGLEKRRREGLERIVPVVVAGNRVDGLGDALEGQPELRFVVFHRSYRVDDVGGEDDKTHVGMVGDGQQLVAQDVL